MRISIIKQITILLTKKTVSPINPDFAVEFFISDLSAIKTNV